MKTTNLPLLNINQTIEGFEKLYQTPITVSQQVMDAVYAFFIDKADNEQAALSLTHAVIVTSLKLGVDPIEVIEEFKKFNGLELDARLSIFMNATRENTSILGVQNKPITNFYIARTILP